MATYYDAVAEKFIDDFLEACEKSRTTEQFLINSAAECYVQNPRNHTRFLAVVKTMGDLHALYSECADKIAHAGVSSNDTVLRSADSVWKLMMRKRKRIILFAGRKLISANPAMCRSSLFQSEHFVSMSIRRSLQDEGAMKKWGELKNMMTDLTLRLKLIKMTLSCVEDLLLFPSDCDTDSESPAVIARGNARVVRAVRRVASETKV
jgi:hypothetical protein